MVPVAARRRRWSAPAAPLSVTVKVSLASNSVSPTTATVDRLGGLAGANVAVPGVSVKSVPAVAVTPAAA